jgi:hypothetical protein
VKIGAVLFIGVVVAVAIAMSLDMPGGPMQELEGVVKGTAVDSSGNGPSPQVATVALSNGSEVTAAVSFATFVQPGQRVRVRESQGIISGRKTYEVFAASEEK